MVFSNKIKNYLAGHPLIDSTALDQLLTTVSGWDIVSQSLSGFTDQLLTLLSQQTFPPPPDNSNTGIPCPAGGAIKPTLTALIGDAYHNMPMVESTSGNMDGFFPVQGGFLQFNKLQVIDCFGQVLPLTDITGNLLFPLLPASNLAPSVSNQLPTGSIQLPPSIIQSSRLEMNILSNDGTGNNIVTLGNPNAVCGWLLPNHLDSGISVYDENGVLLGELLPLTAPKNWRPRPGQPGANPPPATINDIKNSVLKNVIGSIATAGQAANVFGDLMQVIDETLWMIDPMGGRKDQSLSVLIGRPLAVVQLSLELQLLGAAACSQTWNDTVTESTTTPSTFTLVNNSGNIENISFQVKLGNLDLRNDGLIGYFKNDYNHFYAVHTGSATPGYIQPIMKTQPPGQQAGAVYNGDILLKFDGSSTVVTMLMDPRGAVHAATGILPITAASIEPHLVEDFIKKLQVTFQTGPLIADTGTLRTPMPAEKNGIWNWVQQTAPPHSWQTQNITDADDKARMPATRPALREGWLQLNLTEQNF